MNTAYVAATPNGRKLIIALEEPGLDYRGHHVTCDEPGIAPRDYPGRAGREQDAESLT
ncbi:hypothetical protein [Massilia sp. CT11-137]|uniref:hypothetical protein n=1 Tax=Massilia sp. CT11-137 TaxID=3393901 RepID=UPI0039A5DD4A